MRKKRSIAILTTLAVIILMGLASLLPAADAPRITKDELRGMLGSPALALIDVRTEKEWRKADKKITGATWEDSEEYAKWAGNYPKEKTIVLYCS
jgi:rhodanese-related sulfurtransferase